MLKSAAAVTGASSLMASLPSIASAQTGSIVKNGRIKQAICGGCLRKAKMSMPDTVKLLKEMGLSGMDFVGRRDWDLFKNNGLVATLVSGSGSIRNGLNNKSMHPKFLEDF